MCLVVVAWRVHPDRPLIVASNRDERHDRPTVAAAEWDDEPGVFGGRDLTAGGTWLAVGRGRFATVTNVRDPADTRVGPSRGELPRRFLTGMERAETFATGIAVEQYAGFNLIVGDGGSLWYVGTREPPRALAPGIYGLSNDRLDTPWPKVRRARTAMARALAGELHTELFALLTDREGAPDEELPDTGVGLALERFLAPPFIAGEAYGTRASTVWDGEVLVERRWGPGGAYLGEGRTRVV